MSHHQSIAVKYLDFYPAIRRRVRYLMNAVRNIRFKGSILLARLCSKKEITPHDP
jgi:hypothetical protein